MATGLAAMTGWFSARSRQKRFEEEAISVGKSGLQLMSIVEHLHVFLYTGTPGTRRAVDSSHGV